jgi:predicted membrane-bound spermidine synthase
MKAVGVLGVLLATVTLMTAACIFLPLLRTRHGVDLRGSAPHLVYFAAIGFGFMLVEISQLQRLTIFLGHPAYSLSVVLFSLLVSSGIGSLATGRIRDDEVSRATRVRLLATLAVLVVFGIATPAIAHRFEGADTPLRILIAISMLLPVGFCLGMAFPLGMRAALQRSPSIAPWLWGVNGATSVCASVLAVVIAIGAGISAAFWVGAFCYVLAFFAASAGSRSQAPTVC